MKVAVFVAVCLMAACANAGTIDTFPRDCKLGQLRENPESRHTYYYCTILGEVLLPCPFSKVFDAKAKTCVWDTAEGPPKDCKVGQLRENPNNRRTFYLCSILGPVLLPCPFHMVFDVRTLRCGRPNVTQKPPTVTEGPTQPPVVETSTTSVQPPVDPPSTTEAAPEPTPSAATNAPTDAPTSAPTEAPTTQAPTRPPGGGIVCEPDRIYYPDPESCNRFYICSNGTPYRFDCPSELVFNPDIDVCDWPYNYECQI